MKHEYLVTYHFTTKDSPGHFGVGRARWTGDIPIKAVNIEKLEGELKALYDDMDELYITAFVKFETDTETPVAPKEAVLAEYLKWVDQVSDDLEDKTHFTPEEIVYKVIDIMEELGYKLT